MAPQSELMQYSRADDRKLIELVLEEFGSHVLIYLICWSREKPGDRKRVASY